MRDQKKMLCILDEVAFQMFSYHQQNKAKNTEKTMNNNRPCPMTTQNYKNFNDLTVMHVKVVVGISMVVLEQTTGNNYV